MTLDVYSIEMTDRIVQSGTLYGYNSNRNVVTSPSVITALTANGVAIDPAIYTLSSGSVGVQTFVNGVNTTTTGADFVATYSTDFGSYGHVDWSLTGNYNVMSVDKVAPPPSNVSARVKLLDAAAISQLKSTTPKFRATFGAFWTLGSLSVSWKESYYGAAHALAQDPVGAYFDRIEVKPIIITDLEASYQLPFGVKASVGANNLFNNYPTKSPAAYRAGQYLTNASGYASSVYPSFSAFGINGGYYYTRLSWSF
jgi:iron complex outermembrane receptor protein